MATLKKPISVRLEGNQRRLLDYLSDKNFNAKPTTLIRIAIDTLARVAELNKGFIPNPDEICLASALVRRAATDRRRSR